MRFLLRTLLLLVTVAMLAPMAASAADNGVGVVLLHGKWVLNRKTLETLSEALEEAGYTVAMPDMPWSGFRDYDRSYEDALTEIDAAVAKLRKDGATRIVVADTSMGANAALAYGARRDGLLAVVAVSPGHIPEAMATNRTTAEGVAHAREMVGVGLGGQRAWFSDLNQGRIRRIETTAAVYLSYVDPAGLASMPASAAALKAPLLWVVGEDDPIAERGPDFAFAKAPPDPRNLYLTVKADHFTAPRIAAAQIVAWLDKVRGGR